MSDTGSITIQDAIETILSATSVAPLHDTVDTAKTGDVTRALTGIVTTFLATGAVIARAAELGANLIIAHEPTFYSHLDTTDWLLDDPVYQAKRRLLDDHGIVVWRFHDYWHSMQPDGIYVGMLAQLGWEPLADDRSPLVCEVPPMSLADLAALLKSRLGAPAVRVAGPNDLICRRIGLVVGAPGGQMQIGVLGHDDVDAIVCGEINEWETCEYARDAAFFGRPKGLIVVGHANSEEQGMAYLATWLRSHLPNLPITHVPSGDPLRTI
jgi:putative NIF3 family GTP cyclohydrolase 1 type 2